MSVPTHVARQALEALEAWKDAAPSQWTTGDEETITALKAALEQPERHVSYVCPQCYWSLEQPEQEPLCKGIPRRGCNYLAACDAACNKCGKVHAHHQMVAQFHAAQQPEQEPKWRLSCGCPSHYGGIPAEWPEADREGNPVVAYGVICERHWHEYGARHPSEQEPIGSMKVRLDMGVDISFNRSFTLEPGMEFALCVATPKEGNA